MDDQVLVCDELCSYATVLIESHGFMIRTNEEYSYPADVDKFLGITLAVHAGPMNPHNPCVRENQLNKLVYDTRVNGGSAYIMIYRAGRTKQQVLDMIQPQLVEILRQRVLSLEMLLDNTREMHKVAFMGGETDFICEKKS